LPLPPSPPAAMPSGVDLGGRGGLYGVVVSRCFSGMPVLEFMPVARSGVLDNGGQIWDALRLLWPELGMQEKATISFNKAISGRYHLMWSRGAGCLPLAGRGSEGSKHASDSCSTICGWWGNHLLLFGAKIHGSSSSSTLHQQWQIIQLLRSMVVGQPLSPSLLVSR
jgi:hypothetical protein